MPPEDLSSASSRLTTILSFRGFKAIATTLLKIPTTKREQKRRISHHFLTGHKTGSMPSLLYITPCHDLQAWV